jgi:hypothetical protein
VLGDPRLELAQGLALGELAGKLGAELGLPPGSLQEQHEAPRDGEGRLPAEVLFDEGEGQVHARGDPRRGRDAART